MDTTFSEKDILFFSNCSFVLLNSFLNGKPFNSTIFFELDKIFTWVMPVGGVQDSLIQEKPPFEKYGSFQKILADRRKCLSQLSGAASLAGREWPPFLERRLISF